MRWECARFFSYFHCKKQRPTIIIGLATLLRFSRKWGWRGKSYSRALTRRRWWLENEQPGQFANVSVCVWCVLAWPAPRNVCHIATVVARFSHCHCLPTGSNHRSPIIACKELKQTRYNHPSRHDEHSARSWWGALPTKSLGIFHNNNIRSLTLLLERGEMYVYFQKIYPSASVQQY